MLGYDISWAAFNIIEVMSASKFTFKVSGLYENWSVRNHQELLLLMTLNSVENDLVKAGTITVCVSLFLKKKSKCKSGLSSTQ